LCGKNFEIEVHGDEFSVIMKEKTYRAKIGEIIVI